MVKLLVSHGADIEAVVDNGQLWADRNEENPLHTGDRKGHEDMASCCWRVGRSYRRKTL